MPIVYPLSAPSVLKACKLDFLARNLVSTWEGAYDLSEQVQEFPGKRIEVTIEVPPLNPVDSEALVGWLLMLNGKAGTFYLGDTSHRIPYGVATGAPVVGSGATAMSEDLPTSGWTPNTSKILRAGDWIQVGTSGIRRLHKVCQDVDSDGGGNAALIVWPKNRTAYSAGTSLVTHNATGVFMLKEDTTWSIDLLRKYGITIPAIEVLNLS
jgi:hypothetical protein